MGKAKMQEFHADIPLSGPETNPLSSHIQETHWMEEKRLGNCSCPM